MRYSWPGNVRELQSVCEQAILQSTGPVLLPDFLPPKVRHQGRLRAWTADDREPAAAGLENFIEEQLRAGSDDLYARTLAFMERLLLAGVLRHSRGNQSRAAKILGITRGSLRNKIRLLHITINPAVNVDDDSGVPDEPLSVAVAE